MAKKVLVVDDEPHIANLAKTKLSHEGFDVDTANSGQEALDKIAVNPPDVIVLDVMMPGMNGWQVAGRVKDDPETAHIKILMLTAVGLGEERVPEFAKIDEYYTKPFNLSTLAKYVRDLAGGVE